MNSRPRKKSYLLLIAIFFFGLSRTPADAARDKKILIIGVDGCRPDAALAAKTPTMDYLRNKGAYSFAAKTDQFTSSGPSWTSMLTGVWHNKHQVISNSVIKNDIATANLPNYPPFFRRIKKIHPKFVTVSLVNWEPIQNIFLPTDVDIAEHYESDEEVAKAAVRILRTQNPGAMFVHFGLVDSAGHQFGYYPRSREYLEAIEKTDILIGDVLKALKGRSTFKDENWLVFITTDHGGLGTSHNLTTPESQTIFIVVGGRDVAIRRIKTPPDIIDIALTSLDHLGIPIDKEWDLDGRVIDLRIPPPKNILDRLRVYFRSVFKSNA